jgi:hypothetical protein
VVFGSRKNWDYLCKFWCKFASFGVRGEFWFWWEAFVEAGFPVFAVLEAAKMSSASVIADKAMSEMLVGPDWALNLELCDVINSDPS